LKIFFSRLTKVRLCHFFTERFGIWLVALITKEQENIMLPKKIIIPSLFVVLMLTLFLIFGGDSRNKTGTLEARQTSSVMP
jgi:hypothetical protein